MNSWIRWVRELVEDVGVRDLPIEPLRDSKVGFRRIVRGSRRRADDLSSKGLQHQLLLSTHLFWHRDDEPVALDGGREGKANAGVAAGRLDQRIARFNAPLFLCVLDHAHSDA